MKHINTNLFKCFQGIHLREAHPDFDSLQLSQKKNQFQNTFTYQKPL